MLTEGIPVHIAAARLGDDPNTVLRRTRTCSRSPSEQAAERVAALLG